MSGTSQGSQHVAGVCKPYAVGDTVTFELSGVDVRGEVTAVRRVVGADYADVKINDLQDFTIPFRDLRHAPKCAPLCRPFAVGDRVAFRSDGRERVGRVTGFMDLGGFSPPWPEVTVDGEAGEAWLVRPEILTPALTPDPPDCDRDAAERLRAMNAELLTQVNDLKAENRRLRDELDRPRPFVVSDPDA